MKRATLIIVLSSLLLMAGSPALLRGDGPATRPAAVTATYTNPVHRDLPDPHVIRHDGVYYAYGTNAASEGYRVLSSADLVNWMDRGFAFRRDEKSWGRRHFWAPAVMERAGAFYLFYSAHGPVRPGHDSHRICLARADSPLGPFIDLQAPLLDVGKATIDAHPFIDDGGQAYLYYALDISENGTSELYVVPLSDDLTQVVGEPVLCTRPDTEWEGREWNEAPYVFKWDGTYILMYSARGFFDPLYALGFATADHPLGPWKKSPDNPILSRTDRVSGPGHNSVIASPDGLELFCAYHTHAKLEGGHARDLAIDRMTINRDAEGEVRIRILGPTRDPQPMPSGAPAVNAAAERPHPR
jgi:GH43 family beta-xylosidase